MDHRLGIDIGGTFADDGGRRYTGKMLTTPVAPERGDQCRGGRSAHPGLRALHHHPRVRRLMKRNLYCGEHPNGEEHHRISILLEEYKTLRAEVLAARGYVFQGITITIPAVIAIFGFSFSTSVQWAQWVIWLITGALALFVVVTIVGNEINTRKFTSRLRFLESEINRRAGERLLIWETEQGWGSLVIRRENPHSEVPHPPR